MLINLRTPVFLAARRSGVAQCPARLQQFFIQLTPLLMAFHQVTLWNPYLHSASIPIKIAAYMLTLLSYPHLHGIIISVQRGKTNFSRINKA
jgi:hypothetical protein